MDADPRSDRGQTWQDSLDPGLQEQLQRPLVRPGVLSSQPAVSILLRTERMARRLPLLDQLSRGQSQAEAAARTTPIVYAAPQRRETPDSPPEPVVAAPVPAVRASRRVEQQQPMPPMQGEASPQSPLVAGAPTPSPAARRAHVDARIASSGREAVGDATGPPVAQPSQQAPREPSAPAPSSLPVVRAEASGASRLMRAPATAQPRLLAQGAASGELLAASRSWRWSPALGPESAPPRIVVAERRSPAGSSALPTSSEHRAAPSGAAAGRGDRSAVTIGAIRRAVTPDLRRELEQLAMARALAGTASASAQSYQAVGGPTGPLPLGAPPLQRRALDASPGLDSNVTVDNTRIRAAWPLAERTAPANERGATMVHHTPAQPVTIQRAPVGEVPQPAEDVPAASTAPEGAELNVGRVADQVYEILLRRLARERAEKGW